MFSADFDLGGLEVAADRKVDRCGKARILNPDELAQLFAALPTDRDRLVFGICYFCGSRIGEVLALEVGAVSLGGQNPTITFKSETTKTDTTRQARILPQLAQLFDAYVEMPQAGPLFPGRWGRGQLHRQSADAILREACQGLGLDGVSTHSFRRSFVSHLREKGRTPAQIMKLTGHRSMSSLIEYFGA